ncbi:hypothetical protein [Paraburkholderia caledonica]
MTPREPTNVSSVSGLVSAAGRIRQLSGRAAQGVLENAVEATPAHAHEYGEWRLPDEVIDDFEALLALYDSQLASAPLREVLTAEQKLRAFLDGNASSPIPMDP